MLTLLHCSTEHLIQTRMYEFGSLRLYLQFINFLKDPFHLLTVPLDLWQSPMQAEAGITADLEAKDGTSSVCYNTVIAWETFLTTWSL